MTTTGPSPPVGSVVVVVRRCRARPGPGAPRSAASQSRSPSSPSRCRELPHRPPEGGDDVARGYGELSLAFAPAGAPGADFSSTTAAGSIALSADGAAIVPAARNAKPVEMDLLGAASVSPVAAEKLPGVVNDLRGSDSSQWRTEIPTFAKIRYPEVYPGIALEYHGTTGTLEYDFRLGPGADPPSGPGRLPAVRGRP